MWFLSGEQIDGPRRKVVEHLVLYKMKSDMPDEQEKDMLDHLYSLQYHYRGILAVSLGEIFGISKLTRS